MIDFLGIGAQKSATSWLFQCLKEHPSVCLAEEKELHYFSDDQLYAKGSGWYEAHWRQCGIKALKGEISVTYLYSPRAPERIHAYAPHVKLIALLRNPVDRAESHIRHWLSKGDLSEGMSLEEMLDVHPDIFENGRYATHLARYRTLFPKEQLYIDTYDAVVKEPLAVIERVDDFLGISRQKPAALNMRYNSSAFRATRLHDAANRTHRFLQRAPGGRSAIKLAKALGLTAPRLANAGHRAGEKSEKLFTLSAADREALAERYEGELEALRGEGIVFA